MTGSRKALRIARLTVVCTGLFTANTVLSDCIHSAAAPDAGQGQTLSADRASQAGRWQFLRDPALNKSDDLGDYTEDFRTAYAD